LGHNCNFSELKPFVQPSENNNFLKVKDTLIFFKLSYLGKPLVRISHPLKPMPQEYFNASGSAK
jgi:hypothetical protein